jgi:hypothetical protein
VGLLDEGRRVSQQKRLPAGEPLLSTWLHEFVLPLVAGGDVRVSRVFGAVELRRLEDGAFTNDGDERALALAEARQAVMAELLIDPAPPRLDDEALRLAIAVQAMLFFGHPAASSATVRKSRLREVAAWATDLLAQLVPAEGPTQLAARHSILHHLFDLGRDDVRVSFWAGRREFRGQEPPARLLAWQRVRRVREERWRTPIVAEALGDPLARAILDALLVASPLTDLLAPTRTDPPLDLARLAPHLQHASIARAVCDRWLTLGLGEVGGPLVGALFRLYDQRGQRVAARIATVFACHLVLLWLFARATPPDPVRVASEMQVLGATRPGLRDLFGLFAAAQRFGLGAPPDLARDGRLRAPLEACLRACRQIVGGERIHEIEGSLARGVDAPLALAAQA